MTRPIKKKPPIETADFHPLLVEEICRRLAANLRVRRSLPGSGRLHIDRQLPFLCVYRRPPNRNDVGTDRLVKSEASYLVAPGNASFAKAVSNLTREVVRTLTVEFGAFLIVEIQAAPDGGKANDPAVHTILPRFTIHAPTLAAMSRTVEALEKQLKRVRILKQGIEVDVIWEDRTFHPPGMRPLLTPGEQEKLNCRILGITVPPVYRKPISKETFPLLLRSLRRNLSLSLRQAFFEFALSKTTHRPAHFHALGRRAEVKAVWEVDRKLARVSNQFDYLLQLTPVNTISAWRQFSRGRFERAPEFHYRPLPVDPSLLKRELFKIPIERVEDPALQQLFREKQEDLDLQLTMLRDRDTPRFLHESQQMFGVVGRDLFQLALTLLETVSEKSSRDRGGQVDADYFAKRARAEIDYYRKAYSGFKAEASVTNKVSGLMVSRGKLLINADLRMPRARVEALLAHEIGTHLVTYNNGRMQPFQQLYSGLAGYEELQEGLAVLSEFLVGGLCPSRMRQLAARVVAVRHLTDGASFVDTFRVLHRIHNFTQRAAYYITMRVYRAGGLTKDAVYLRGLRAILKYVQDGQDLSPLLVGKMAIRHIPIIRELQYRKVLKPAPIVPRHLREDKARERLQGLRGQTDSVLCLVKQSPIYKGRGE